MKRRIMMILILGELLILPLVLIGGCAGTPPTTGVTPIEPTLIPTPLTPTRSIPLAPRGPLEGENVLLVLGPQELDRLHNDGFLTGFRNEGARVIVASTRVDKVWEGPRGETLKPDLKIADLRVSKYDIIVIACREEESRLILDDANLWSMVVEANRDKTIIVATELAPLLLARTGILQGMKATMHYSQRDEAELTKCGVFYIDKSIVIQENIITARWITGRSMGDDLVSAIEDLLSQPQRFEWSLDWYSEYEEYLARFPDGRYAEKAKGRLTYLKAHQAIVQVEYPEELEQTVSSNSDGSLRWEWDVVFKETGGQIGYRVKGSGYIVDSRGVKWGRWTGMGAIPIDRGQIQVQASGIAKDRYWWSSSGHTFCNGYAIFSWEGEDEGGHPIRIEEKVHLKHTGCLGPEK